MRMSTFALVSKPILVGSIFTLSTGLSLAQCGEETFKLLPSDGAAGDRFGVAVAISDTTAIVGAYLDGDHGAFSGSAYLFDKAAGGQVAKLVPSDGAAWAHFGNSVAISGNTAIVGAHWDDALGVNSGAAYLFDATTGVQLAKLVPSDGVAEDDFGTAVAISGTTAIVGAIGADPSGAESGAAYLFDTTTGAQLAKLIPGDGNSDDHFGCAVALSGTTAIVGSRYDDDLGSGSGSAYLFDTTTGAQLAKLLSSDGTAGDHFGWAVAVSGTTAIIGAHADDDFGSYSGSAYLFDTTTGLEMAKLLASDGAIQDEFGYSVGISGSTAIVGARKDDDNGTSSGAAYLFDAVTGTEVGKILPGAGAAQDYFGEAVAISGSSALVGASENDDLGWNSGSAYVYPLLQDPRYCTANFNSTGAPAKIFTPACASASLSINDFSLLATPVPNGYFQFFYGTNQVQLPFGNGFLCASGSITRLGPATQATDHIATRTVDLPIEIGIAGTVNFQCWFRDLAGGGAGFNTSDGISVTIVP